MDGDENPVERTRRQLECYYKCVTHNTYFEPGDDCPDCGDDVDEPDDDDLLGLPRY